MPARRELTVYKRLMFDLNGFKLEVFTRQYLSRCRSFALGTDLTLLGLLVFEGPKVVTVGQYGNGQGKSRL